MASYLPKFTGARIIANSGMQENANIAIGGSITIVRVAVGARAREYCWVSKCWCMGLLQWREFANFCRLCSWRLIVYGGWAAGRRLLRWVLWWRGRSGQWVSGGRGRASLQQLWWSEVLQGGLVQFSACMLPARRGCVRGRAGMRSGFVCRCEFVVRV